MPPLGIDRHALHELLWKRSDRLHRLRFVHKDLADELACSQYTVSRLMHELANQGRVRVIGRSQLAIATYQIMDPSGFEDPKVKSAATAGGSKRKMAAPRRPRGAG